MCGSPRVVMLQVDPFDVAYRSMQFYHDRAYLLDLLKRDEFIISYKAEEVNWELILVAGCMLIEEVMSGFDLSGYFGDGYNVCLKGDKVETV